VENQKLKLLKNCLGHPNVVNIIDQKIDEKEMCLSLKSFVMKALWKLYGKEQAYF